MFGPSSCCESPDCPTLSPAGGELSQVLAQLAVPGEWSSHFDMNLKVLETV